MSEKTEKATPKKLQDSRKKGQVGQSQDVPKLLIAGALLEVVLAMADDSISSLESMVATPLYLLNQPFLYAMQKVLVQCFTIAASLMVVSMGIAVIMRLVGAWIQFGFLFAPEALKLDFNKLNPFNQLKNMFSGKKLFEVFNGLVKATVLGFILYLLLMPALQSLIKIPLTDLNTAWHGIMQIFIKIERTCLMSLLVIASVDFGMQKYFYLKGLRMSKDDIKQEHKNSEGDPHTKGHRRSEAQRLATDDSPIPQKQQSQSQSSSPEVGEADALVVNPTHFAVALYYRPETTPLPQIISKGEDEDALDLIEQAKQKNIPIIRFVWLARTLYKEDTGQYIPRETLRYVAKIYQVIKDLDEDAMEDGILPIPDLESL